VVNIPNVVWIDEQGMIVRPAEPGWPPARPEFPSDILTSMPALGRAATAPPPPAEPVDQRAVLAAGQDRASYHLAIRDWVEHGAASRYAMTPSEVVAASRPRSVGGSEAAAHFELANHFWAQGQRDRAIVHFNECHRLAPDNWTYKRQAWSLVSQERVGGQYGRFAQGPLEGEEGDWPFASDFRSDVAQLRAGEYYPKTIEVSPGA
jgi:hypothetical protein